MVGTLHLNLILLVSIEYNKYTEFFRTCSNDVER